MRDVYVINREQLAVRGELEGEDHGGTGISMIFVVQEGQATMTAGDRELTVGPGDVVVVPAGMPHRFVNSGSGRLRQIDIHLNPRYATEWLEG